MSKGRWEDMKTYWAWRESPIEEEARRLRGEPIPPVPGLKKLEYVTMYPGQPTEMKLCVGVWNFTPLHQAEQEWHKQHGG